MPKLMQNERAADGVQAVALTLQILEALAASNGGTRITELAKALGTTKTRIFRHLRTLMTLGYVVQDASDESYRVGVRLATLGRAMAETLDVLSASRPIMKALRDDLGNTVILSVLEDGRLLSAEQIDGRSMMAIGIVIGSELGLHSSAQGKVALAFGPADLLDTVARGRLRIVTSQTITDPDRLRKEVEQTRKQGWATAPSETMTGLNSLAAPVFIGDGKIATLAILGSVDDISEKPTRKQITAVVNAAREISGKLTSTSSRNP
ncbi:MAG: IclR family transcriptional regulator [Proteobacteria bacterium]|nr:IclR family transcriptional regulator [Pseudomonadota bacterium]